VVKEEDAKTEEKETEGQEVSRHCLLRAVY